MNEPQDSVAASRRLQRERLAFVEGPIQKFVKYRRWPFKLLTNVLQVVLLICLISLYVGPLLAAIGSQRHMLIEKLLSLPKSDDSIPSDDGSSTLPASFQARWHGDYVQTPRIMLATLDSVADHVFHVHRMLASQRTVWKASFRSDIEAVLSQVGFGSESRPTTSELTETVDTSLPQPPLCASIDGLDTASRLWMERGCAICNWLSSLRSSQNASLHNAIQDATWPSTASLYRCGSREPPPLSARCASSTPTRLLCTPCLDDWTYALASNVSSSEAARMIMRCRLLFQQLNHISVHASAHQGPSVWSAGALNSEQQGITARSGVSTQAHIDVAWDRVGTAQLLVRVTADALLSTIRDGFFSTDSNISPDDGYLVVALLMGIAALSIFGVVLRVRALRRIMLANAAEEMPRHSGRCDDEPSSLGHEHELEEGPPSNRSSDDSDAEVTGSPATGDTRRLLTAPTDASRLKSSSSWSDFLQSNKGRMWHIAGIVSDGCCFAAVVMLLCERSGLQVTFWNWTALQLALAYGAFGQCCGLVQFLRFTPRAYLLMRATRRAMYRLAILLVGVIPLFFGFAHLFTIAFGSNSSGEFESFGRSLLALIFMMFGDNLLPAFRLIDNSRFWWMGVAADLSGCLYVAIFMSVVLNLIISVVVDTYADVVSGSHVVAMLESDTDDDDAVERLGEHAMTDSAAEQEAKTKRQQERSLREEAVMHNIRCEVIALARQAAIIERRRAMRAQ